ncbi:hypothetical protein H0H81_002129 [Sphagnurus paluster]|uniref:Phospholipase/carboxylesterase/thioesterase domain-containing protein n=1 Tax=Sphagnurus paluster TaxID=117069 RepID=A0A9P7GU30_9AGAR|nr:hypothetical protein H0H81_002129 [Sphagnurus paluster]
MSKSEIHIQQATVDSSLRVKLAPKEKYIPVPFAYLPSDDGTDENLLILLHGLGDTHVPFMKLGQQLKLPQTAVLALRAPEQIPFLYEDAFQWYRSFDDLGELIQRPNPTPALDLMTNVVGHLVGACGWPSQRIHFFGFAQGGSVAAEFALAWQRSNQSASPATEASSPSAGTLGSIVSISGPLLSYPTLSSKNTTPILVVHTLPPAETALQSGALAAYKKAFETVVEKTSKEQGMPSSRAGWEPIMQFWSTYLGRRQMDGLYEVLSGTATQP